MKLEQNIVKEKRVIGFQIWLLLPGETNCSTKILSARGALVSTSPPSKKLSRIEDGFSFVNTKPLA